MIVQGLHCSPLAVAVGHFRHLHPQPSQVVRRLQHYCRPEHIRLSDQLQLQMYRSRHHHVKCKARVCCQMFAFPPAVAPCPGAPTAGRPMRVAHYCIGCIDCAALHPQQALCESDDVLHPQFRHLLVSHAPKLFEGHGGGTPWERAYEVTVSKQVPCSIIKPPRIRVVNRVQTRFSGATGMPIQVSGLTACGLLRLVARQLCC
mmetsp:Transcript_2323/g.6937  ORF Transcript_2323/g.6937 Transcript_2323/m.6937 type:complete len:203 (+) Transcript_2323:1825-2433(+)